MRHESNPDATGGGGEDEERLGDAARPINSVVANGTGSAMLHSSISLLFFGNF